MIRTFASTALAAVFAAALVASASAQTAQPAYTADDVIKHFAATTDMGADRALCIIGSASCTEAAAPSAQPAAFDMRVQFELNSAELTPGARDLLNAFAEAANRSELRRATFNVDGHTDARGGEELNQDLSERRADAVVSYLESRGVASNRLVARGFGKSKPLTDNPLADENRRVEATISGID